MDAPPSENQRVDFEQWLDVLRTEHNPTLLTAQSFLQDSVRVRGETPNSMMILAAKQDGMDIRESMRFIMQWCVYRRWSSRPGRSQELYPDVWGMLSVRDMQFWTALRRGWGNWGPSQGMLDQVREMLERYTNFNHRPHVSEIGTPSSDFASAALSRIQQRNSTPEERIRLVRLLDEGISQARFLQVEENWYTVMNGELLETSRMNSESHFSTEQLRLDRLERLIREERLINARRRVRDPDGRWQNENGDGQ
jgi:hypothetical protein